MQQLFDYFAQFLSFLNVPNNYKTPLFFHNMHKR